MGDGVVTVHSTSSTVISVWLVHSIVNVGIVVMSTRANSKLLLSDFHRAAVHRFPMSESVTDLRLTVESSP